MTRQPTIMPLAFKASQQLDLPVKDNVKRLAAYLLEQHRVVAALLNEKQLTAMGPGRYQYTVTTLQVFQLQVKPVVSISVSSQDGLLKMNATDAELEGLGLVDDFELTLEAILEATPAGLQGEACLGVQVTQPALLKLIPSKVLESTGQSILNGILLGIKGRVGKQLITDFRQWCQESPVATDSINSSHSKDLGQEGLPMQRG